MEPKILVVDDEARIRRLMEAMLIPAGYNVILAENGNEAVTKALLSSPDVILLDVMMPVQDGFEVASSLRENERTKDIPVVMITALGDVKDRVKALESGADDFLTKPVDETELLTRVKTLVEKAERIKALKAPGKRSPVPAISIIVAVIAAVTAAVFTLTSEPETDVVVVEKPVIQEVEVIKEVVEKEIEYRDVVKEVTVEKPVEQKEFSSKEQLIEWLGEDDNTTAVIFSPGDGEASDNEFDCDDYALNLQQRALKDGFLMSTTITEKDGQLHMINLTVIGNEVYYIEPQTDEVWFYCYRD